MKHEACQAIKGHRYAYGDRKWPEVGLVNPV
jgi:hypothetical protein